MQADIGPIFLPHQPVEIRHLAAVDPLGPADAFGAVIGIEPQFVDESAEPARPDRIRVMAPPGSPGPRERGRDE